MSAAPTALRASLLACSVCGLVCRSPDARPDRTRQCPRCGAGLHFRKPDSLARTTALLAAAAILYIPANAFPMMTVVSFGRRTTDTIFSGVIHLAQSGMWPIALLVFFASIVVPVLKLVILGGLVISVHRRSPWRRRQRTRLYRLTETIGRWSMVDIFMMSILAALVRLEAIATIEPGVGATAFAAVVILTMLAATTFDPRLIWDTAEERHG